LSPKPALPGAPASGISPAPQFPQTPPSQGLPTPAAPVGGVAGVQSSLKPKFALPSGSPLKFLPIIIGAIILIGVLIFAGMRILGGSGSQSAGTNGTAGTGTGTGAAKLPNSNNPAKQITLSYWGLWAPTSVLQSVFDDFSKQNPGVTIQYQKQSPTQYRERLQSAIASGTGPDLFRFHASWVPMLRSELSPAPSAVMTPSEFENTFYPIATKQLVANNQVVGMPLMYDGLALYYNKDIFETANLKPPATWAELRQIASDLTIRTENKLSRGGVALGNSTNVEHFADIIGLLMVQNGADPSDATSPEAIQAVTFYTNFVKKDQVWDDTLPSSTVAFSRGDVAMMIAPSWRAHEVQALNPNLQFAISPVPKLADVQIGWASFWAEGVSSQSKNKDISWKLLAYMSSNAVQQKLYSDAKQTRSFGEIYSRRDLASQLINDPYVGAYLTDAPTAQSWYLNSFTHDNGLNDQIIKYYLDAVTTISTNAKSVTDAMITVGQGTSLVLRQFGLAEASAPAAGNSTSIGL